MAGDIDTAYLERHDPAELGAPPDGDALAVHAAAAALAGQARRRVAAPLLPGLPTGWRNVPNEDQVASYTCGGEQIEVRYRFDRSGVRIAVGGRPLPAVHVHRAGPAEVDLTIGGIRRRVSVHRAGAADYVDSALGSCVLTELDRFPAPDALTEPGSLLAPMPGTVVRIAVTPGETVATGAPVVAIEAMKMEHAIRAPAAGRVTHVGVSVGQAVDTGTQIARVEPLAQASEEPQEE